MNELKADLMNENENWLASGWNSTVAYLINIRLPELATRRVKE
jgi:hypothetical protein